MKLYLTILVSVFSIGTIIINITDTDDTVTIESIHVDDIESRNTMVKPVSKIHMIVENNNSSYLSESNNIALVEIDNESGDTDFTSSIVLDRKLLNYHSYDTLPNEDGFYETLVESEHRDITLISKYPVRYLNSSDLEHGIHGCVTANFVFEHNSEWTKISKSKIQDKKDDIFIRHVKCKYNVNSDSYYIDDV